MHAYCFNFQLSRGEVSTRKSPFGSLHSEVSTRKSPHESLHTEVSIPKSPLSKNRRIHLFRANPFFCVSHTKVSIRKSPHESLHSKVSTLEKSLHPHPRIFPLLTSSSVSPSRRRKWSAVDSVVSNCALAHDSIRLLRCSCQETILVLRLECVHPDTSLFQKCKYLTKIHRERERQEENESREKKNKTKH